MSWDEQLRVFPIPAILETEDEALRYLAGRDLLGEPQGPIESLWELREPQKMLRRQQPDGSWRMPGKSREKYPDINHDLYETYKHLRQLVGKWGFHRRHEAIERAAEYIFSCQTADGDLRGILGNQHIPYYNGAIVEVLIEAGYAKDSRIKRILEWLAAYRVDDGGWAMPMLLEKHPPDDFWKRPPLPLDRSLPFSHMITGMAIRGFVTHPKHVRSRLVREVCTLLKGRFLQADKYGSRKARSYWLKFQYPFFWPNLLTGLDTLGRAGFSADDPDVAAGLAWFVDHQEPNGLWPTQYEKIRLDKPSLVEGYRESQRWIALAVCRMLKRFSGPASGTA